MPTSKPTALDDILSNHDDNDHYEPEGRPGRKPGQPKPQAPKAQARNTQAWRAIEDMKDKQRLDGKLKEVYEEE